MKPLFKNMNYQSVRDYNVPAGLGDDQKLALETLYDWYYSDKLECTLSGFAGTGKTFVVNAFINSIVKCPFTVTAPTHKALRVLELATGVKGQTLHSLHGLRLNLDLENLDIERPQFDPKGNPKIQYYKLIIIDEASMINKGLFMLNRSRAKEFKVKILYVGDNYQLPPIGERESLTFTTVDTIIHLNQVMRQQKGNPIIPLFDNIRYDIDNGTSTLIDTVRSNKTAVSGNEGYQLVSTVDFKDRVVEAFKSKRFSEDPNLLRIATYTNKAAEIWNTIVRNEIIQTDDILHHNDLLIAYTTMTDDFNQPVIINSEDYMINDLRPHITGAGFKAYVVSLKSITTGLITPNMFILDHSDQYSVNKFLSNLDYLHARATTGVKGGWLAYYKFRDKYMTMKDLTLPIANAKVKRTLDYGYAITTHKLQGSTLTNTAIDLTDIVTKFRGNLIDRNKLIYVALSRAKRFILLKY